MNLTMDEVLEILFGHTMHMETGELEYYEWAAKLIQISGYTVAQLKIVPGWDKSDYQALDDLKANFPNYKI